MSIQKLQTDLKQSLRSLYVFTGDEGLMVERAERLVDEAAGLSGSVASFNRDVFRADEDGAEQALSVARTLPMLAPRRVVLIRGVEEAKKALMEPLLDYCQAPADTSVVVISGAKWPKPIGGTDWGRRIQNAAKKTGLALTFKAQDQDPVAFARAAAEGLGCRLGAREARLLVELVGRDLGRLQRELEKASAWLGGGGDLTEEVLREVCSLLAEAEGWDLTDALVTGETDLALATAHRLLEEGEAPHRLLGSVTWKLRQMLLLQDAMRSGMDPRSLGIRMPNFKLQQSQQALRRRPMDEAATLDAIARANQLMNSHRAGDRRIFEGLLLSLLAAGR